MPTTARNLVTRALALIRIPGQGAVLPASDLNVGFEALRELLASEAVSEHFQPGIRTHFFALPGNKNEFTYGPGGDLDTRDFSDPTPIRVTSAFLREGAPVTSNELVANGTFDNNDSTGWTLGSGGLVQDNKLRVISPGVLTATSYAAASTPQAGVEYRVSFDAVHRTSSVTLDVRTTPGPSILYQAVIDTSGSFEGNFIYNSGSLSITITPSSTSTSMDFDNFSITPVAKDRFSLGSGTDYPLKLYGGRSYNLEVIKGAGGRPDCVTYSRQYPLGLLRMNNTPGASDVLVTDVVVDLVDSENLKLDDELPLHPQATRYLRYLLARELAGEFSKTLTRDQWMVLREAKQNMNASNFDPHRLRVDAALTNRGQWSIEGGDY